MIHRDHAAEFSEWADGPNEGPHMKWILHGNKDTTTHLASVYIPGVCKRSGICPKAREDIVRPVLDMLVSMRDIPFVIMASIN